ncbi:MAG: hypothetical protein M1837_004611 [Sclerophora amabilis]|nr:MAG: hypothetical protein M1837_004611 [Sclerophora amabilis]
MDGSSARKMVRRALDMTGPWSLWRAFILGVLVANIKSLPFIWHYRILRGLFHHVLYRPANFTPSAGPKALFQPIITSSRTSLSECDYNIHKSNSSYFSDLDISRLHLMACLGKRGIEKIGKERKGTGKGKFGIVLGGVSCTFRREIKPYQSYEIWSRVLSWDRKWLYIVSHFVRKGAIQPSSYTLQPWRREQPRSWFQGWSKPRKGSDDAGGKIGASEPSGSTTPLPKDLIFATATAKYVIKEGRLTVPPERFWEACGLLPARPSGVSPPSTTTSSSAECSTVDITTASAVSGFASATAESIMDSSLTPSISDDEPWTWKRVEEERKRGMRIAEAMDGLDSLDGTFTGPDGPALGEYHDLF